MRVTIGAMVDVYPSCYKGLMWDMIGFHQQEAVAMSRRRALNTFLDALTEHDATF